MEKEALAKAIYETAHLQGSFKLRSGQTSHHYFDKYLFESNPRLLTEITERLMPLVPAGTEILAGLRDGRHSDCDYVIAENRHTGCVR